MSDPFRQYFLESIHNALQQEASHESLLALFRFVTPSLTMSQVLNMSPKERNKLVKVLKSRIHPDKHPNDSSVTKLFQNVQIFYEECILSLENAVSSSGGSTNDYIPSSSKRRRKPSDSVQVVTSQKFPQSFSCYDQWPHVQSSIATVQDDLGNESNREMCHPIPPNRKLNKEMVPVYQAYKCIHARGAIAHGKAISLYKTYADILEASEKKKSVYDVFGEYGGTKELDSIEMMKEELMQCGPVISISFRLLDIYLEQLQVGNKAFAKDLIGASHELLIVGWCLTPYGEAWLVQPLVDTISSLSSPQLIRIGFGQFGIDDLVLAPKSSLDHISWQPGPYFDYDFSDVDNWREWNEMDLPILEKDLKKLALCLPGGFMSGQSFVIRDEEKKAHSGCYRIKNIRWVEETMEWFVQVYQWKKEDQNTPLQN
mmetsp:Transcript_12932/g.24290  ORF Transcript_12932/g.24290 Transcript_12932/m.24290 type:complete len:428 (-) Transcript_12932:127-1410(-)|eukprot:CAMPEP_0176488852 /NCGR_PEP_ID=MMETSP0200_2-20121128/6949_1 /TAXON_ID=947934 /ORGANISM="Chaetoceros sp., Strain GSL56" /LENGTH=427 /DNA_ID=CAMNT_0017885901 /DNA_START=69 /DNA_END=1352 /DNA_ORIENTATION=+